MKAIKYKIKISIDPVHSWGDQVINEIFIPEVNVCFNEKGGCFFSEAAREGVGLGCERTEVDDVDAIKLKELCIFQEEKDKILVQYFEN